MANESYEDWELDVYRDTAKDIKIQTDNGHYLTEYDCFLEMNDRLRNYKYPDGFSRAWWEQFQYLRGQIKKPYWIK